MKKKFVKKNALLDIEDNKEWKEHWKGMPEFISEDLSPYHSIIVHFNCNEDIQKFAFLIKQKISMNTKSIYYPAAEIGITYGKRYKSES